MQEVDYVRDLQKIMGRLRTALPSEEVVDSIEGELADIEALVEGADCAAGEAQSKKEDAESAQADAESALADIVGDSCPFCGGFLLAGQLPQDCLHCARRDREIDESRRRNPRGAGSITIECTVCKPRLRIKRRAH